MQMKKNSRSEISRKACNILRLALLWARKGGVFKRRLAMDISKFLHTLRHCNTDVAAIRYHYGEREFSFDDTPVFHVKMHRPLSLQWFRLPRIPCINPQVGFDYDFNDDKDNDLFYLENGEEARLSFLRNVEEEETTTTVVACEHDGEGIDMKAEEFIAKFYHQIKLQRQISLLSVQ
ncbi:hypothetical protein LguiB_000080 [Lonicera macranthoides]